MARSRIHLRLSLLAADEQGLRVCTVLDETNRVRRLPTFSMTDNPLETVEGVLMQGLGLETEDMPFVHWQQLGLHSRGLVLDVAGLIAKRKHVQLSGSDWWPLYSLFPWEDWRKGAPTALIQTLLPEIYRWCGFSTGRQAEKCTRVARLFADDDGPFQPELLMERYDMLYGAGLLPEALRDRSGAGVSVRNRHVHIFGQTMMGDDRQMLARAVSAFRRELRVRPLPYWLISGRFSLGALQRTTEALLGLPLHTQNFRRDIMRLNLLDDTGRQETRNTRRPARLYAWRDGLDARNSVVGMPCPRKKI